MPIKILSVRKSPRKMKRFQIYIQDGEMIDNYHFGLLGAQTYIDHGDKQKRDAYQKRHLGNPLEKHLIDNMIPSPALFSYKLLWGESNSLQKNISSLQQDFNRK